MSISVPDLKCWVQFKGCQLGCFGLFLWLPTLGWEFLESRGRALFTFKLSQSLEQYLTQRGISTFLASCSSLSNSKSAFNFCFGIFYLSLFPPSPLRYASLCKHLWWCITLIQNGKDNARNSFVVSSLWHPSHPRNQSFGVLSKPSWQLWVSLFLLLLSCPHFTHFSLFTVDLWRRGERKRT